ncbi:MAG: hypothetical protein EBS66_13365 [Betaproteobacteria bacterium]|nr:hypothetical protein [Betaproteobacteria bacterium]
MPLTPDPKWLEAFKLPLRVMIGISLASYALLWLDSTKHIDLSIFGILAKPAVVVLMVVVSALALSGIGSVAYDIFISKQRQSALAERKMARKKEALEYSIANQAAALNRLNYLTPEELRFLTDCLRKRNQSFTTWVHSSYAATLVAKGLIYSSGGTHHEDHYPFTIIDFVWNELLVRKDEFIARDDENKKQQSRPRR